MLVTGGSFNRDNNASYPATVSDFRLDKYEVTVGRFRAFLTAGMGTQASPPGANSGANPNVVGSGWDSSWNPSLPGEGALENFVNCAATYATLAGAEDTRPINCIDWYVAFAFCIWDGGRLPTELEWNYAAAGGSEQRTYPWGNVEPGANADLAVYGCHHGGSATCTGVENIAPVGTPAAGAGRWGHLNLAGNVAEWTLDGYATYPSVCNDCADVAVTTLRTSRGTSFRDDGPTFLRTTNRSDHAPTLRNVYRGIRCARNP
jgi:formylglycine-generating enzyme required for sulfatase activity